MEWLRIRRRVFIVLSVITFPLIIIVGPDYGSLQTARDAAAFGLLVGDERGRYIAAAVIDLIFALAYGLGALSITLRRRLSVAGGVLVSLGALADVLENRKLLRNIADTSLKDGAVDRMRAFGQVKYALIGAGLLVLFAAYAWDRREHVKSWVVGSWVWLRYSAFVALVLLMVPVAHLRNAWGIRAMLLLLGVAAIKLNAAVREDRGKNKEAANHGAARLILATMQLGIGGAFVLGGDRLPSDIGDAFYFLGIALVVMSFGAFVSELRQNAFFSGPRSAVLLIVALAAFALAATSDSGSAITLVLVGLLVGELGTELLSECYQRASSAPISEWTVGALGLVVLVVGLALFVNAGADPGHVLLIAAALAVVVFMASADGDALIIVLIVAVALVWATSPREADPSDAREPKPRQPYFVVFGDSYISGEGATRFIKGTNEKAHDPDPDADHINECRRATTAWPFRVAERAEKENSAVIPSRVLFLGCSGADTENIHTKPRLDNQGRQHGPAELALFQKELERLGPPTFAVISIGGNDAGFGEIGKTCLAPGNCAEVGEQFLRSDTRHTKPDQLVDEPPVEGGAEALRWIDDDLKATFTRVKNVLGNVPVIAVAYPIPLTESGACRGVLLDEDERRFIRGFVPQLNGVIRSVAAQQEVHFMEDMQQALLREGSQLCSSIAGKAGLNFFALNPTSGSLADSLDPRNWIHNSLHPNESGHNAMARVAFDWLSKNLPTPPPADARPHVIGSITEVLGGVPVPQCASEDRASCRIDGGVWVGEQVHGFYARSLFPLTVLVAGLWLCINPVLRWAETRDPPITAEWVVSRAGIQAAQRRIVAAASWLWGGRAAK